MSELAPQRAGAPAGPGTSDPVGPDDSIPYRIVRPYRVRFDEATAQGTMRTAIALAWMADCAWQHSVLLGYDRDWYARQDLFWLVRAIQLDVLRPIPAYAEVMVSTRVSGYRRIACRRESDLLNPSGELLGRAEIDWVMTNGRGVPTRVPAQFYRYAVEHGATFEMHKASLPTTPADALKRRFDVRRRDLDPLDHVNNSVYVDYLEEALEAAGQAHLLSLPRRYMLDFVASAARADVLVDGAWPHGRGWAYRLYREDGAEIFRALLEPLG